MNAQNIIVDIINSTYWLRSVMTQVEEWISELVSINGLVKAMVFPVVMYGCESWTMKKAEC